jgi:hypothetical protein
MARSCHYDTVAFDVRDDAVMLFFADTRESGDISSYLLLMRAADDEMNDTLYLEIDETQAAGEDVLMEAELTGNRLTLSLFDSAASTFGDATLVLTFDDNAHNRAGIEAGALRVLGDKLVGGHS